MNKKIEFSKNGEKYVLEYNREAIQYIEARGFVVAELDKKPMTMLPLAFQGLFYKNHKKVSREFMDECYNNFKDKSKLLATIADMLNESYTSLLDDNNNEEKNIEWEIVG